MFITFKLFLLGIVLFFAGIVMPFFDKKVPFFWEGAKLSGIGLLICIFTAPFILAKKEETNNED